MDALLTRTTVVTSDPAERVIGDVAVAVQGDRIVAVGASSDLEDRYPDLPRQDLSRRAVIPGLINCHTHTILTVLRGGVEDLGQNVKEIVYGYMIPVTYVMTDDERRAMSALGCLEAIRSGTTTMSNACGLSPLTRAPWRTAAFVSIWPRVLPMP